MYRSVFTISLFQELDTKPVEYLRRLKLLVSEERYVKDLDSLAILTKIFADKYFSKNIEVIMAILARAMVTIGVESVVESWVSVMESQQL